MIRISDIHLPLGTGSQKLLAKSAAILGIPKVQVTKLTIYKKSVDARQKNNVHFIYTVDVDVTGNQAEIIRGSKWNKISIAAPYGYAFKEKIYKGKLPPVVVGAGPAGLFAALSLAEQGLCPIVIERGADVSQRIRDVANFRIKGILNEQSNIQFGEGGAGTFSDGKLTTGIKDIRCRKVLEEFCLAGAPPEILFEAKPHIGTDRLTTVVQNIRKKIIRLGGRIQFNTQLIDIQIQNETLRSVTVLAQEKAKEIEADALLLATGHSARDTFEMLYNCGVSMVQKQFAVGLRIEHLQRKINQSQYGKFADHPSLGAADYKLATHLLGGRGAYTFCMCPGGEVVPAASEKNTVVVNGMSRSARDGNNANSALLVGVSGNDFGSDHPLAGIEYQRLLEKKAYALGGGHYKAPVQLTGDFLKRKESKAFGRVEPTYLPGVNFAMLCELFSEEIADALRISILQMDRRLEGFAAYDSILTGVESRSSSPVRIVRDEKYQSSVRGIYPCGEGAGYAGGIVSSAVDGIKCAEAVMQREKE